MSRSRIRVGMCVLGLLYAAPDSLSFAQGAGQAASTPSQVKRTVRGVVFDDANGNGQRDAGEAGIGGAAISDQFGVTQTSADGAFELAADGAAEVVFVSVPDGWVARGAFWQRLEGGTAEQSCNFALQRQPAAKEFTFIHASDTHLSAASVTRMAKLREVVERTKPAFVLISGDLIRDALRVGEQQARGEYDLFMEELKKFTVPVWTVPGNHEVFGIERHLSLVSPRHPLYGKKMYRHYLGPNYYSFNFGGVHFVGVDSVDVTDLWYHGRVDAKQMEWLARDLATVAPGTPVVTFNHIPFMSAMEGLRGFTDEEPAPTVIRLEGRNQFRHTVINTGAVLSAIQKAHRLEIALGGHFHTREMLAYETQRGRVRFFQTGAVIGPNSYAGITMVSGVTLYRVRDGKVDDGTFLPLD